MWWQYFKAKGLWILLWLDDEEGCDTDAMILDWCFAHLILFPRGHESKRELRYAAGFFARGIYNSAGSSGKISC